MKLKQETMDKLRSILKNDWDMNPTDEELYEIAFNLTGLGYLLMRLYAEDARAEGRPKPSYANAKPEKA